MRLWKDSRKRQNKSNCSGIPFLATKYTKAAKARRKKKVNFVLLSPPYLPMNDIILQLHALPYLPQLLALLAAILGAMFVMTVAGRLMTMTQGSTSRALADYTGQAQPASPVEQFGLWLEKKAPSLADRLSMKQYLRWLELTGDAPSPAMLLGQSALFFILIFGLGLLLRNSMFMLLALLAAVTPYIRVRSKANDVKKRVDRSLPDLAALISAEMAAGNPPDKALRRAAEWGGPLSAIIHRAVQLSATSGMPLFSRERMEGALVRTVSRYDLPALQSFVRQLDLAARKGSAGPEQMQRLTHTLIIAHKERSLREAEKLDGQLAVPAVLFFFLPFMMFILAPMIYPLLQVLGGG